MASNVEALRSAGFDYLNGAPDFGSLATTGNGLPILLFFEHAGSRAEKLSNVMESYFETQPTALVSCEVLFSALPDGWEAIIDACEAINANPSIIVYVRNVYPSYLSSYNQLVKQHGEMRSFQEFVEQNRSFACKERLEFFAKILGSDRLSVAHYESEEVDICRHFLSMISPAADISKFKFDFTRVNRSLDEAELRFMRIANRFPKAHFPGELSNLLISSYPERDPRRSTSPEIVELLTLRHGDDVAEINEKYFGGRDVLRIADDVKESGVDTAAATASAERLFEWAMARLDSRRHKNLRQFVDQARSRAIYSRRVIHPDIPPDFEPAAYLLANPDLLSAGVDPYRHFLDHGRSEGRTWRTDGSMPPARRRTPGDVFDQAIRSVAKLFKSKQRRGR